MASTATLIPVSEYLAMAYRPDRDYVNGQVKERHAGERPHSFVQTFLASLFQFNGREWHVWAQVEQRVQVNSDRYRIPDICVLKRSAPFENVVTVPPLLCIEVLSPRDTLAEVQDRVSDYVAMGVPHIWVIDPVRRRAFMANDDGLHRLPGEQLTIAGTPILVSLADLWAELDEAQQVR